MVNKNVMTSRTYSGTFPSPDTPPSGEEGLDVRIPKGWSSERVPRSSYRNRRQVASAALMPFSSGRTLPSKWEDAERWICSPVSLGNVSTNPNYCYFGTVATTGPRPISQLTHSQRRAKSKSGPLGPVGPGYYTGGYHNFSPVLGVGVINGAKWRNSLTIESPGMTSARFEERLGVGVESGGGSEGGGRRSCPSHDTTTNWLNSWSGPPSPTQALLNEEIGEANLRDGNNAAEEDKYEGEGEGEAGVYRAVSRRDMATQMFPESEESEGTRPSSSPKSFMSSTSPHPLLSHEPEPEPEPKPKPKRKVQSAEYEVRDVQVDKQASCTRSRSNNANHVREDANSTSSSNIQATDNHLFKIHREEAKINAWENLQKAKAESAIQKLEEKLEKKRESSMNKIIQKLRKAEIKATKMRSSISSGSNKNESQGISKTTSKNPSFCIKLRLNSSFRSCTSCYPF